MNCAKIEYEGLAGELPFRTFINSRRIYLAPKVVRFSGRKRARFSLGFSASVRIRHRGCGNYREHFIYRRVGCKSIIPKPTGRPTHESSPSRR
jgi:hypothetical protein